MLQYVYQVVASGVCLDFGSAHVVYIRFIRAGGEIGLLEEHSSSMFSNWCCLLLFLKVERNAAGIPASSFVLTVTTRLSDRL